MTREDRRLLRKLETLYGDDPAIPSFPPELGLDKLMQLGYLSTAAFYDETVQTDRERAWRYTPKCYPLSQAGYEELHKNWYLRLSENPYFRFTVDLAAAGAFVLSVILTIRGLSA